MNGHRDAWRAGLLRAVGWFCVLGMVAPAFSQTGPVGYWKVDEGSGTTTADASGNSHTGTLTNSPTWTTGYLGNALSFNGSTAQVGVSAASGGLSDLYTNGMTVAAWIKPSSAGGGGKGRIIDKDNNDNGWYFAMNSTSSLVFGADQFATTAATRISGSSITLNTWQHVVVTWDGSATGANIHFYVNGTLSDGTATNGSGAASTDASTPFTLGNRPVDNARGFSGALDEVRVYNRILSTTEIQALADSTPPSAPSGLTATAASSSQISLSWTASTDNIAVTQYLIERCSGASCSNFAQVGTATGTTYNDSGLTNGTSYSYRVRATDAGANLSAAL